MFTCMYQNVFSVVLFLDNMLSDLQRYPRNSSGIGIIIIFFYLFYN